MKVRVVFLVIFVGAALFAGGSACVNNNEPVIKEWTRIIDGKTVHFMTIDGIMVHETDQAKQPLPVVVTPGKEPGDAPSDAVVLFDGSSESFKNWTDTNGGQTKWILKDGAMEPTKKSGYIQTKQEFGSCQLHIEWATPEKVKGNGQGRGNSGVFFMGYEIQMLDSYENTTYADGQAGALYGRKKPLINACRKPGQWQSYDVIFHQPVFDADGNVLRKATFTVLHNGVLIQDHYVLSGGTGWRGPHSVTNYHPHADKLPLQIQDHGNPVKFRNVWIREL